MSDIVERLRHQPLVLYGREQVIADISLLSEAADEIEFLNKVIEVERKEHKEAVKAERKKHTANENKCGNCYFFIPNVGLINRNEHTKDGMCGRHAYEKVFCGKEDYCSLWLAISPKGEDNE